ncbi:MAG TPA: LLM class flavin-dependent oxidoreductase [Candidatus Acidoferrales bacterium]|nr:LLM class flavin-dependent oxidoreductase [Candidatus Acidoferrales bacterium]
MNTKVEFGIAAPQIHTRFPVNQEEIRRCIQRVEALGFDSLWVQEQAGLRAAAGALEGVALLSYAAALTSKARLGNAVFLINLRNPIQLAKSLASLDQLSQGRVVFGVGLGAVTRLYGAYGLSPEKRVARFVEALSVIKKLWTEDNVDFDGRFWQLKGATLLPKPFQKPHPPIWFGAHAAPAVRRAARLGDGFIGAGSSSTADFQRLVEDLRRALAEARRDAANFMIAKRVYIAVDRNSERARERTREWFSAYYGTAELADKVALWGSPQACADRLREVVAAGARLIILNPMYDMAEQMEQLAEEVVPGLA